MAFCILSFKWSDFFANQMSLCHYPVGFADLKGLLWRSAFRIVRDISPVAAGMFISRRRRSTSCHWETNITHRLARSPTHAHVRVTLLAGLWALMRSFCRLSPICDLKEWIPSFTGRMSHLFCIILGTICASKCDVSLIKYRFRCFHGNH